jgi:hypothetical protein
MLLAPQRLTPRTLFVVEPEKIVNEITAITETAGPGGL